MIQMKETIKIPHIEKDFAVDDFTNKVWETAETVLINKYWSGADAPPQRQAVARMLWTDTALYVRFDCEQHEPFVISENPDTEIEAERLWERDVCEMFIAPNPNEPEKYFEFEVAPTGEWLDFALHQLADRRETDKSFNSGMKTAAQIYENSFSAAFRVEWQAFGKKPEVDEEWRGNLFRCVGANEPTRYLAWQPTRTEKPNFHVPQSFGFFQFVKV